MRRIPEGCIDLAAGALPVRSQVHQAGSPDGDHLDGGHHNQRFRPPRRVHECEQCTRREGRVLGLEVDGIVAAFVRPGLDQAAV